MSTINTGLNIDSNTWKQSNRKKTTNYTARDFESAKEELLKLRDDLTEKWTSTDEADPGIVLIKEAAQVIDLLSYNQDKQILECFPNSVTQLKNARQLYGLVGYKMKWYRSATCRCDITNTYSVGATLPRFSQFNTANNNITYINWEQVELPSNTNNNGQDVNIELVQGVINAPTKKSGYLIPAANKPWHDIYNYNVSASSIVGKKIPISTKEIDQNHILLIDDNNEEWTLVDSVATQVSIGKFFELRIDEYNQPYLYLVDYWENFNVNNFKLFYLVSMGEAGQIAENTLVTLNSPCYSTSGPLENPKIQNIQSFIIFSNYASTWGYNPETPDEAREEATKYINTANTIVTLDDATRFCARLNGVANCLAMDKTNDPGTITHTMYGDLNQDGTIDSMDRTILENYLIDKYRYPLTEDQLKLADLNGDGKITESDLACMDALIAGDDPNAGRCGNPTTISKPLEDYTCKVYITRSDEYEIQDKLTYLEYIKTQFEQTRHIALTFIPDVDSIEYYYWTVKGTLYLKSPQTIDICNDILVRINKQLNFDFRPEAIAYNQKIKFIDVVHSIENKVDDLIDHVDLDMIEYETDEGEVIDPRKITGDYETIIENKLVSSVDPSDVFIYNIKLDNAPIRPNYLSIVIDGGDIVLKDNGNGKIPNQNSLLQESGKVDYATGEINLKFNRILSQPLRISYAKNQITMPRYTNLSTLTFKVAADSIKS